MQRNYYTSTYCGNGAAMAGRSVLQTLMEIIVTQICFPNCLRQLPQWVTPQPPLLIFPSLVYDSIIIYAGRRRVRKHKVHPTTRHEGPDGEKRYSPTLSLTSGLNGVGWSTSCHGRLNHGKETRHPLHRRLGA